MNTDARWMDTKEISTRTRKALKQAFPATKFSVRMSRYSMGSNVLIEWRDGPTVAQVQAVYAPLDFYQFDGMQDLRSTADARYIDGELVRGSASFSTSRTYSQAAVEQAILAVREANHSGADDGCLWVNGSEGYGFYLSTTEASQYDHFSAWSIGQRALQDGTEYPETPAVFDVQADPDAEAREAAAQAAAFQAIKDREALIQADIDQIEAAFGGLVEAYQSAPGRYQILRRKAVPASGPMIAEDSLAGLLELAADSADLLKLAARKVKPRLQVWSDGTVVQTPELWAVPAGRVLN